jgi:alcohol dehydrogenase (quinone), cytochrome c subunit
MIYSTNITPDKETGIGAWSENDFTRALREGVRPDGRRLFPAFPYTAFTAITDEDAAAVFTYLKTLRAVRYTPPRNGFLFRQRWALLWWNALWFKPARYVQDSGHTPEWNRGAYLTNALGHCGACHTPRNGSMAEIREREYTGGRFRESRPDHPSRIWSSVNLTPSSTGIGSWSAEELAQYLKTGFSQRGGTFGPMNEVISNSTRYLSDADLRAMAVYMKSLPENSAKIARAPDQAQVKAGQAIYSKTCEQCHAESGRGSLFGGPRLAGSAVVQAPDAASLINVILYGPDPPDTLLGTAAPHWETMHPYNHLLSDGQVVAVCNYIRNTWGNHGDAVTLNEVARQRE